MKPYYSFSDAERAELERLIIHLDLHPYRDFHAFSERIDRLVRGGGVPRFFVDTIAAVVDERRRGARRIHVIRNCPVDRDLPQLDNDDPVSDKHARKNTFVSEAFLCLFAAVCASPLLAYADRNNGDFFTDVIEITKFKNGFTGFSGGDLVYHVDRAAHNIRADYINLLGLRCPTNAIITTNMINGADLLKHLSDIDIDGLRRPHFYTDVDSLSRSQNMSWLNSEVHPVLGIDGSIRYIDTLTKVVPEAPALAKDALIAMKSAIARSTKTRHQMEVGDLLSLSNRHCLHNREIVEADPSDIKGRWLLKTYAFENNQTANQAVNDWGLRQFAIM